MSALANGPRRRAGKCAEMGAVISIERPLPMNEPGTELVVQSDVSWQVMRGYTVRWRPTSG